MNNNWWGPPDEDDEPLPEWMRADTYRNPKPSKPFKSPSLEDAINSALKKPPVDLTYLEKTNGTTKKD